MGLIDRYNEHRSITDYCLEYIMGTTQRRRREAAYRRKSILDAGRKIFWAQGYHKATVPQIATEAELAPGTLYLYFPSKAAIYAELLVEGYDHLLARLQEAAAHISPTQAARGLVKTFFDFAREAPEYFQIMFFVLQGEGGEAWEGLFHPQQIDLLKTREAACHDVVAQVLERIDYAPAQRRSETVAAVWSMLAGVVFYFRNSDNFDAVADQAATIVLAGTLPDA